jgi:hypothetical protein
VPVPLAVNRENPVSVSLGSSAQNSTSGTKLNENHLLTNVITSNSTKITAIMQIP